MAMRAGALDRGPDQLADIVGRLREGHDRIREVLGEAVQLAERAAVEGATERVVLAAWEVMRFLTLDMVLHEADEDASIAPRLCESDGGLEGVVERVEEHVAIDALVYELAEDWHRLAIDRSRLRDPLRHRAGVGRLRSMLDAHLAGEERDLFPRVAALSARDRLEIIVEMEQRRAEA